jgi:hypothetical protein
VLQEENSNDGAHILTPVKEEIIKPEITIEEDDMLIVHNDSLGLAHFFLTYMIVSQCLRYVQVIIVESDD